jgi:hypothetical protein
MTTPVMEPNDLQDTPFDHKDSHSNAMRYFEFEVGEKATVQVSHPRLSLIPNQLLSETRKVEQDHERRGLTVFAKSREMNMLLV